MSAGVVSWLPPALTRPSADYAQRLQRTGSLLRTAQHAHGPLIQASSLGAEDLVITHLAQELGLGLPWFVIDTGRLHTQTLHLLQRLPPDWLVRLRVVRPDAMALRDFVAGHGLDGIFASVTVRQACCAVRKVEPLQRALHGYAGWVTGMRRDQSDERQQLDAVQQVDGRYKINPLADWSWGDVWHYLREHQVPTNPLHDARFPSIGCEPCTRAISAGEPLRAGRWWWEQGASKECGLHQHPSAPSAPTPPVSAQP